MNALFIVLGAVSGATLGVAGFALGWFVRSLADLVGPRVREHLERQATTTAQTAQDAYADSYACRCAACSANSGWMGPAGVAMHLTGPPPHDLGYVAARRASAAEATYWDDDGNDMPAVVVTRETLGLAPGLDVSVVQLLVFPRVGPAMVERSETYSARPLPRAWRFGRARPAPPT